MRSGYSIAQLLLKDGDGFCIVRFGTGEEEVVKMQDTKHLVSQPLVGESSHCAQHVRLHGRTIQPQQHWFCSQCWDKIV